MRLRQWNSKWQLACGRDRTIRRILARERGSASIEFLGLGVVLLCPIAYGMVLLTSLEQSMLATELAARNSARVLSADFESAEAHALAQLHIEGALANHGLDPQAAAIHIECAPDPNCHVLGSELTVTVRITQSLPYLPFGDALGQIPVESSATFPRSAQSKAHEAKLGGAS